MSDALDALGLELLDLSLELLVLGLELLFLSLELAVIDPELSLRGQGHRVIGPGSNELGKQSILLRALVPVELDQMQHMFLDLSTARLVRFRDLEFRTIICNLGGQGSLGRHQDWESAGC